MINEREGREIEGIVKELIRERISSKLTDTDIKNRGIVGFDVTDSFLTDIMALGYNNYSEELATNDIYELQSKMPWVDANKSTISNRIKMSLNKFKVEIDAFIVFVESASSGLDRETIINNVKKALS